MIHCKKIMDFMEKTAPASFAESYDNVGLMLGDTNKGIERVLVCLDVTAAVVDEAIEKKADMIISHHPLIFKPLKSIRTNDPKGNNIYRLIRNDICVYAAHTNLDIAAEGVNDMLAKCLGLRNTVNLKDTEVQKLFKVVVFVPEESTEKVREAMCRSGAGFIGNYSDCTFYSGGTGTFTPLKGTNPYTGSINKLEKVNENRLETVVPEHLLNAVICAMVSTHPYEEIAYDVYRLELDGRKYGLGRVGDLDKGMPVNKFINLVKISLGVDNIRLIGNIDNEVRRAAVFCGSFDDDLKVLKKHKADILVTGDVKYHTAVDAVEMGLCIIDAGHFHTEKVIIPALYNVIKEEFPDMEIIQSTAEKDPYLTC